MVDCVHLEIYVITTTKNECSITMQQIHKNIWTIPTLGTFPLPHVVIYKYIVISKYLCPKSVSNKVSVCICVNVTLRVC